MAKFSMAAFLLDTHLDEKWQIIEARYGLKGFAIIVKLLQRIYGGNGYYCEWSEFISELFANNLKVSASFVNEIVRDALSLGLFDLDKFNSLRVLTSRPIQKNFLETHKRKICVEMESCFLCDNFDISVYKNLKIVYRNQKNVYKNTENVTYNKIKQNKTKQNKIKQNEIKYTREESAAFENVELIDNTLISFWETITGNTLSSLTMENIYELEQLYGIDLTKFAMELTVENNVRNINYTRAILQDWKSKGIKDLETAKNNKFNSTTKKVELPAHKQIPENYQNLDISDIEREIYDK